MKSIEIKRTGPNNSNPKAPKTANNDIVEYLYQSYIDITILLSV